MDILALEEISFLSSLRAPSPEDAPVRSLTSTSPVGIHPFCHVQYTDPHYSYEDHCTAFLFIHLPSTQSSLNDLQCVPAVLGPPFVCVVSS